MRGVGVSEEVRFPPTGRTRNRQRVEAHTLDHGASGTPECPARPNTGDNSIIVRLRLVDQRAVNVQLVIDSLSNS